MSGPSILEKPDEANQDILQTLQRGPSDVKPSLLAPPLIAHAEVSLAYASYNFIRESIVQSLLNLETITLIKHLLNICGEK